MQVDNFTEVEYNGTTFVDPVKSTTGNVDAYAFAGEAANLVITVQRAAAGDPQQGDIVEVKIPASLIPLRNFDVDETKGTLTVNDVDPIRVKYASSVKAIARENLFTPDEALKKYIDENAVDEQGSKSVAFYANKWSGDPDLGDTIANFKPAATNRYYFFQKQTPIYTDPACTQPAKEQLASDRLYYYQDEFEIADASRKLGHGTTVIEFAGRHAAQFADAVVADESGNLSFSAGTARLAFIDELHTDKNPNATGTASDVLNPRWNDTSSKATATHVNSYLGNNGKISYKYNMTPATVDTKASFGLTKVLEGRAWTDADEFKFELSATSENDAPMPTSATAIVTKDNTAIGFGEITYTEPGTYVYKVSEKNAGTTVDGITYSGNVAEITVTVTPNKKGKLSAAVEVTSGKAKFENTYTTNPVESSVTSQIAVAKVLTGRDLTAGEFSFELREVKGGDSELIETVENDAEGNVTFKPIKYTEIGQHTYTLHEVAGDAGGIDYDNAVYTIVTTIADNGKGELVATHELKGAEGVKSIEFKNAYNLTPESFSVTDQITATKVLDGRDLKEGEFSFELVEGNDVVATGTNDARGKITMTGIEYTAAGEHAYTLREVPSDAGNGITYDGKTYTIETTITDKGDGTLEAKHVLKGDDEAKFNNSYKPNPDEFSVTDQITATKVLTGRDMAEGEFSFELVEGEGKDAKVVATGTNNAEGKITMNAVKYDKPGKHTYTLREAKGNAGGITYSDAKFTIETTITDNGDGTLKAEHVLKGTEPAEFKNTYSVTPIDTELDFGLSKAIEGREWTEGDKFSFTITAPEGTPLPDPATATVSKNDAKDGIAAIKFGKIHYTAAGTYKYEIRENAGNAVGMTYDGHVATAEVTVTDNGKGVLTANVTKKENGRFTNTYRPELDYAAAGGLKLSKTLSGRPMTEGQFTFTVTPADAASANALGLHEGANVYKSTATAEATVGLIDILAGHEVKFTQADAGKTFTYTVAEKNDGQPGYTYDEAVRTVTIAIADDGAGTLTATTTVTGGHRGTRVTVSKSGENKVESALVSFANSYHASTDNPGTAAQVVATKILAGRPMADGEFWFGIAYQGELVAYENLKPNIGGHVSFDKLHYDTKMLANLEAAGLAYRRLSATACHGESGAYA